jgi:hypothetical protein
LANDLIGLTELRELLERDHDVKRARETISRAASRRIIPTIRPAAEYLVRRQDVPAIAEIFRNARPGRKPR